MKASWTLILAVSLLALGLHAAEVTTLEDILLKYKNRGFNFVYSKNVVDTTRVVEWPEGISSIPDLNSQLQRIGLTLNKIIGDTWGIARLSTTSADDLPLNIPPIDNLENIIVTASLHEVTGRQNASFKSLDKSQIEQMPSFAGDAIRIVHRLPGAATLGVSSKPNVRGGIENELLVVFDGVELIDPFHLRDFQSMLSTFNPQTISNIDYFTGGFPAQYGNRMSGVMDIATQDNFEPGGGELGISLFTTSALFFGENEDITWLFSARRGNLDLLLDKINPSLGKPRYHDLYGKLSRSFGDNELSISGILFEDDIRFTTDEETATSKVKNRYVWSQFKYHFLENWYGLSLVSIGQIDSERLGETRLDRSEGTLRDLQDVDIFSVKQLIDWRVNDALKLSFGFSFSQTRVGYDTALDIDKGTVADVLGLPGTSVFEFHKRFKDNNSDIHATLIYKLSKLLTLQAGLRADRQSYGPAGPDYQISPRLSVLLTPTEKILVRLSYGRFHQPQSLYELETADGETDFSKSQRSDHYIVAGEFLLNAYSKIEVEFYYKSMSDLKPRHENLFNPYIFLPETEPDRFTILASRAYAKGFELTYSGNLEPFEWNVNYSYSKVQDKEEGRWINRRWDQPNSFNASLTWHPESFDIGIAAAWHTGWSYTTLPDDISMVEEKISSFRSNDRLKDFATLDIRIAYNYQLPGSKLIAFIEATNLPNRDNESGVEYEIVDGDEEFELEEVDLEPIFPLVISMGVIWRF